MKVVLAKSRTVLVERLRRADGVEVVQKTYSFPQRKDRVRGMLRGTWLGKNKAQREYMNLKLQQNVGFPVVEALDWTAQRNTLGFVTQCRLEVRYYPFPNLEDKLKGGEHIEEALWFAIGASVKQLHAAGVWHRGLSARNLLVGASAEELRWLDPSKSQEYGAGRLPNAARAHDLLRFWTPLASRCKGEALQSFVKGYGKAVELEVLWEDIPFRKRASSRREMQHEEARWIADGPQR